MALIELNLEKPALKRVESVPDESSTDTGEMTAEIGTEKTSGESEAIETTVTTEETGDESDEQQSGGGRVRRYGRRMAILGGTAAGIAAARKLRQRRKGSEQQELEEDWQTAE